MSQRYHVYFAGELARAADPATVRNNLARLFKADDPTLDKLLCGQKQLVKKDCDQATAVKYRDAMARAGAVAIVEEQVAPRPAEPGQAEPRSQDAPQTAAERIAALAAAEDDLRYITNTDAQKNDEPGDYCMELAPPGADLLRADEKPRSADPVMPSTALAMDAAGERLSTEQPTPPPAPDTAHLEAGEPGDDIPNLPRHASAVNPDTSGIDLSPPKTGLQDCAPQPAEEPAMDLSNIVLTEAGSYVLEERYRQKDVPPAPATDHLSVQE